MKPQKRLGEILIDDDIITPEQLKKALEQQREGGGFLGQILIEQKAVSQDTLISYLAKQCQIPHLSLLNYRIGPESLSQVPKELCLKHYLIPVDKMGRILTLAMVDPLDTEALEEIKKHCPDLRIKPVLCSWEHFQTTIKQVYSQEVEKPDNLDEKYSKMGAPVQDSQVADKTIDKSSLTDSENVSTFDEATVNNVLATYRASKLQESEHNDALAAPTETQEISATKEIASAIRDSIQGLLTDLVAKLNARTEEATSMSKTVRQVLETIADRNESERRRDVETLAQAVKDSVIAAVSSSRNMDVESITATTLASIAQESREQSKHPDLSLPHSSDIEKQSFSEKHDQLARIAEAILGYVQQTAQLVEANTVAANNRNDMLGRQKNRHSSVAPFLYAGGQPAAETSELRSEEDEQIWKAMTSERPLETLTFDNFFAGEANAFTFKIAQAIARAPGSEYNPFFLYGKVGVGKTHLISAIGNANMAISKPSEPNKWSRIGYVSASHFARRLMSALAENALDIFRENYCHWDLLILDDIQFLGGHVEAQEEFFHIFNVLQQQGRQIVIAGDKAPDRLGMLEQRLISRFSSGIVADLKPPEWETRMAILHYCVEQEKAAVPEDILSMLATRIPCDVRKMTGALRKIIAFSRLESGKISVEDAQKILTHLGSDEAA